MEEPAEGGERLFGFGEEARPPLERDWVRERLRARLEDEEGGMLERDWWWLCRGAELKGEFGDPSGRDPRRSLRFTTAGVMARVGVNARGEETVCSPI